MEIIDNKALLLVTSKHKQITTLIPKSKVVEQHGDKARLLVNWGFDEAQILRNLGIKNVPNPILGKYHWPGVFTPFAHQKTTAAFLATHPRCFVLSDPGTGKTSACAWAADYLMTLGRVTRVLIICPMSIMDTAWRADLFRTVMHRTCGIATGSREQRREVLDREYDFTIINFDGVKTIRDELEAQNFDLIIVDECFPAGTPVATASGLVRIETLKTGDKVLTSSGEAPIKRVVRTSSSNLVKVTLSNGESITCTKDHPFFTDLGWITAENLAGRLLISGTSLPDVRERIRDTSASMALAQSETDTDWDDLFSILRSETIFPTKPRKQLFQSDTPGTAREANRCCEVPRSTETNIRYVEENRTSTSYTGREWKGNDALRETNSPITPPRVDMELPSSVGGTAARISYKLQARFRMAQPAYRTGGGWGKSWDGSTEIAGSEKRAKVSGTRVESVTHIQCPNPIPVFNLEVDGTPNYFVGKYHLVHNCNAVKNVSTDRWKALASLVKPTTRLWMMTGTPASQSPMDAYGMAKLVNPAGVPRFPSAFRDQVMVKITQFKWVPRVGAQEIVFNALQPAIRYTKEECLDLPDMLYTTRHVELTKQQKHYYEAIRKSMMVMAAGEEITAINAAGMLNKLLQISQGAVYSTDREVVEFDVKHRLDELLDVISQTRHKVIVFVPFRHVLLRLEEELAKANITTGSLHGGVSAGQRSTVVKAFQTEDDPRVLLAQPAAVAHGLTLTRADTVVWWGPVPSAELYLQGNARAHRAGQTNKVTVVRLQGSPVEKRMYSMLDDKVDMHSGLVELFQQEIG